MLNRSIFFIALCASLFTNAQSNKKLNKENNKKREENVSQGYRLFKSERASWMASDILVLKHREKLAKLGGYVSYEKGEGIVTIFWDKKDQSKIQFTFSFPDTSSFRKYNSQLIDTVLRTASDLENRLINVKLRAVEELNSDTTLFKHYLNSSFNLIPVVEKSEVNVYVLTAPKSKGKIIFGNDYLLRFNSNGDLLNKKRLHNNIIVIEGTAKDEKNQPRKDAVTLHSHSDVNDPMISPSDVCTLLLYGSQTNWLQHYVMSSRFVSIWDRKTNSFISVNKEDWDKIKEQGK